MKRTHKQVAASATRKAYRAEIAWINRVLEVPARVVIGEIYARRTALQFAIRTSVKLRKINTREASTTGRTHE